MSKDSEQDRKVEYRGTGFYVGLVVIILFALVLFIVAVQNTQEVQVQFLGFVFSIPLFGVAIGAAMIAVVLDELIGLVWRRRRRTRLEERAELNRLRARAEESEQTELDPAQVDPITDLPPEKAEDQPGGRGDHRRLDHEQP